MILLGGCRGPMLLEDANDVLGMAVALKRIVPADRWVDEFVEDAQLAALDQI